MAKCLPCQLVWLRVRSIPGSAGRWGKFLSCLLAAMWAAAWITAVAMVPLVGNLGGNEPLRVFGATLGLVSWTCLLLEMIFQAGVLRPTMGCCLIGIFACRNADIRLARLMAERQA